MDAMTDGEREIHGQQFYLRLRNALCICSVREPLPAFCMKRMHDRVLSGGGMLVTSAKQFPADYQKNEALTWEHQALTCACSVRLFAAHRGLCQRSTPVDYERCRREGKTRKQKCGKCAKNACPSRQ
ncbi:hypothetical protein ACNKHN_17480 [Shigella flexneri]